MAGLKTGFISGRHPYDVIPLQEAMRSLQGLDPFFLSLDDWTADKKSRERFEAVVFYHMYMEEPSAQEGKTPWYAGNPKAAFEALGKGEGITVLHHGLVAFPDWPLWGELTGLEPRRPNEYKFDKTMSFQIADPEHPINKGLKGWTM